MHEWALAESILTAALQAAEKENLKKITEIRIGIGELQQIEHDIFSFALNEMTKDYDQKLNDVKFSIETEESTLQCQKCDHQWNFQKMKEALSEDEQEEVHFIPEVAFVHFRCPKCGSPDFQIKSGRGVSILSLKGKR